MSATATAAEGIALGIDPALSNAVIESTQSALTMCGVTATCVGASRVPLREGGAVTGMIGVHGKVSGFVTVNMSERFAVKAVEGLLQDEFGQLTSQVVDGTGEITNIVVGGIKSYLANSTWAFSTITVPSVIVGSGYQIAFARGLNFVDVIFEHNDPEAFKLDDRLIHISLSLLKL